MVECMLFNQLSVVIGCDQEQNNKSPKYIRNYKGN